MVAVVIVAVAIMAAVRRGRVVVVVGVIMMAPPFAATVRAVMPVMVEVVVSFVRFEAKACRRAC